MSEERKYENPHNKRYIKSFQRMITEARRGDHEVVLRYLMCRDERLDEFGVVNDDLLVFLERNRYNTFFHDQIFKKFDPEFESVEL